MKTVTEFDVVEDDLRAEHVDFECETDVTNVDDFASDVMHEIIGFWSSEVSRSVACKLLVDNLPSVKDGLKGEGNFSNDFFEDDGNEDLDLSDEFVTTCNNLVEVEAVGGVCDDVVVEPPAAAADSDMSDLVNLAGSAEDARLTKVGGLKTDFPASTVE